MLTDEELKWVEYKAIRKFLSEGIPLHPIDYAYRRDLAIYRAIAKAQEENKECG